MRLFEGTQWDRPPRCEQCGELEKDCCCPPAPQTLIAPQTQTARVTVEKRSKGKLVTIVRGLSAEGNDLQSLLLRLKTACGAGGTLKGELLEIQGNHTDRIRELLAKIGYRVQG